MAHFVASIKHQRGTSDCIIEQCGLMETDSPEKYSQTEISSQHLTERQNALD